MTTEQICIMATIIAYLCFVIFTGVMIGRRSKKSAEGFYLGGRGIGPLVTAMSAEASDMSSYLLMGIPGLAYLSGVADASWTAIGLAFGTYLNFLLVAKRLRRYSVRLDAITIPSFISKRYGEKKPVIMCISAFVILIFFVHMWPPAWRPSESCLTACLAGTIWWPWSSVPSSLSAIPL